MRLRYGLSVLGWVLAIGLTACGQGTTSEGATIKAGVVMSVGGIFAGFAQAELNALQLAIDEINEQGGILGRRVELIFYDDEGDQAKSIALTNRLIHQDKVQVIFGPNITPTGEVIVPISEKAGILRIGFIAQQYLWEGTKYTFMTWPAQTTNAEAMVKYARECANAQRVAILYADVPYGIEGNKFLKEHIARYGLRLVYEEKFQEGGFEFTPQATRAAAAQPDVVFLWGSAATSDGQMFKQLRQAGFRGPIIMDVAGGSPLIAQVAGPDLTEGLVTFGTINYVNPDALTRRFIEAYSRRFGSVPPPYASIPYDAPFVYKAAVEKAGTTDPRRVAEAMIGLQVPRVTGTYRITEKDHVGVGVESYKPLVFRGGNFAPATCPAR
jgi:branched-chain amino acid transport system substrate-binding protein